MNDELNFNPFLIQVNVEVKFNQCNSLVIKLLQGLKALLAKT